MRVTFLLVAFLAGAHSFKAVERRAVLMGKGGGGQTARSVVEDAIQPAGLLSRLWASRFHGPRGLRLRADGRRGRRVGDPKEDYNALIGPTEKPGPRDGAQPIL